MTSSVRARPSRESWAARSLNLVRRLFAPGDIPTLLMAAVLLMLPALSMSAAGWPLATNVVYPIVFLSVGFGFLLARSQYNELLGLFISTIYGGCFVLLIAALSVEGGLGEGVYDVFSRLLLWLVDATSGGINQDDLVFTVLVAGLFWFLGYNLSWHLFRIDRVWRAVLPPALILIANTVYYTGEVALEGYLIGFVFITLLLVVRSNLDQREWDWYLNGIRVPRRLRRQFFLIGTVLSLLLLTAAWIVPSADLQERLARFQEFMQSEPLMQISEFWNRLISSAETQGPTTSDYYGSESLQLGGAIRLGDEVVLLVNAPQDRRYYWRSRTFDSYDNGRWTSGAEYALTDRDAPFNIDHDPASLNARVPVTQTFTLGLSASRIVYAAPQPLEVGLPTRSDLRYTPDNGMEISVIRPLRVLYEGDSYGVTSLMSTATAEQLRSAGTVYPEWMLNDYSSFGLQSVSSSVFERAQAIVQQANATTPYDRARAIESWLRTNIEYDEVIPPPPPGRDPVEWFLFELQRGYCNYYASAMVVMLRGLGIPARMSAGFAQGEWSAEENAFVVRERDAHTWVEVYFPGYGWIEFEPTAAQAPINRGDEVIVPPSQPPTEPAPTSTPTPSPTPTPLPTEAPLEGTGSTATPDAPPTPTVSPQPSPTPTPVIVPTPPPPLRPPTRGPLSLLLPALGAALLGLLLIVLLLLLLVFIYWWWEWRGMRGLSPVVRAWARLERYLALVGLRPRPQQTPEERRGEIVRKLPAAEPPVSAITRMYTNERYGPSGRVEADGRHPADRAWSDARGSILGRFLRRIFAPWRRG